MTKSFIEDCTKRISREVKVYPRKDQLAALESFVQGFERSLGENYPEQFHKKPEEVQDTRFYSLYALGINIGNQFGPLEVEPAREEILEVIDKRKQSLQNPNLLRIASDALNDAYRRFVRLGEGK
jgi:hypothetical protein